MAGTRAADVHPPYHYPDYKSTRLRAPAQATVRVTPSPLELAGPAFPKTFVKESEADLTTWGKSAPLDPNFLGKGQVLTDDEGRYRIVTVKPGAYPWQNHAFAWRPAHIHFSLFGNTYAQRLITQMFFPGDPLLAIDPIFNSVPEAGRKLLLAELDLEHGVEGVALGYRFDMVLHATPMGV